MTIPENNTVIIILQLVLFPLKTSVERKKMHFCSKVPLGVLSAPGSLASSPQHCYTQLSGEQHGLTCKADALGAVTQVHHHSDLRREKVIKGKP